ncbi:iron permease FTR1 family protein [Amylocarpus encephaloides]|uniref:Iron permease FTR1 family protein n=1 Tax=Amylocarpus encephaloides TaxID=45428 RepID=A0A9P7YI00_9HELO|nr:iron permease FTR1 family protein [Amylocarpus encephaloides]
MTVNVFAVPVFFVVFRETLEAAVIVSVLLAFLKQTLDGPNRDQSTYKKLVLQVWYGSALGLLLCLIVGGGLIGAFYGIGKDKWGATEYYWEGSFSLVATLIISILGAALLRVAKLQDKWRVKLAKALEEKSVTSAGRKGAFKRWCEKYAMFLLPFITVLREGIEAIIFIAGVTFSAPAAAVPLPVICGLLAGFAVGFILYKGGSSSKLQIFLVVSTCLLYLVAAGLFSKAIWYFQQQDWNNIVGGDAAEVGAGAGSYDIDRSVWHVNYGNPELNGGGGWGIFNAIFGWTNSATYGSVISYNVYWIAVIIGFILMRYNEQKGHLPLMKAKKQDAPVMSDSSADGSGILEAKKNTKPTTTVTPALGREISE